MSISRGSSADRGGESFNGSPITPQTPAADEEFKVTESLEDLQTDKQRRVLDTVAQLRNCGLEGVLPLPQLVVCGDQSAGKSSVLEALTEVPFPRSDNVCTRFATEIILRRANTKSITVKVIPDDSRSAAEEAKIRAFSQTIMNFAELPKITDKAKEVMGIQLERKPGSSSPTFSRDVLSIEICGPTNPQLTVVDLPGLIASETEEASITDVQMATSITEHYIEQPRTICLAVVSAMNDVANQGILSRVLKHDPNGDRTLGIITKPDIPPKGSGLEKAFIRLAKNENVRFKLGWHVVRNRAFEEEHFDLMQRNLQETAWFQASNFKVLPEESLGISSLRTRLSALLFEHIQRELPNLRRELGTALVLAQDQLKKLGGSRSTTAECREYLLQLSAEYEKLCKASIEGHYENSYFRGQAISSSEIDSRRTRALVQTMNKSFSDNLRVNGHKYQIYMSEAIPEPAPEPVEDGEDLEFNCPINSKKVQKEGRSEPVKLTKKEAFNWVNKALKGSRGMELMGTYNPALISQLFWEQSEKWKKLASDHMEDVSDACTNFLRNLLHDKAPKDVESRLWTPIEEILKSRRKAAVHELDLLIKDLSKHPMNYNHYFTDNVQKRREDRRQKAMEKAVEDATSEQTAYNANRATFTFRSTDASKLHSSYNDSTQKDIEGFSCEDALDNLFAIYKVLQKVFVANVTTQVIERHIVDGLDGIFNPLAVYKFTSGQAEAIASEPANCKNMRAFLQDRINKLEDGERIFRTIMGTTATA